MLRHEGRELIVYVLHTFPAEGLSGLAELNRGFADLATEVRRVQGLNPPAAFVLCGDFNASPLTPHVQSLLEFGLREAHAIAGWGPGTTWPNWSWRLSSRCRWWRR